MIQPNITHLPCDLNQQREREEARRDSVARAIQWRRGERSLLDRVLRRHRPGVEVDAASIRHGGGEDVFHAFSV